MASKRIFSLRLNDDVRQKLLDVADKQGTTITALINRYILSGLTQDEPLLGSLGELESHVVQTAASAPPASDARLEELLFQVLQNQRLMEMAITRNQKVLEELDRKSTRLNSSHPSRSRMPSSA